MLFTIPHLGHFKVVYIELLTLIVFVLVLVILYISSYPCKVAFCSIYGTFYLVDIAVDETAILATFALTVWKLDRLAWRQCSRPTKVKMPEFCLLK